MDLEQMLASVPLFAVLDARTVRRLAQQAVRRSYAAGATIVEQGETGTALYVIASGRVRVEHRDGAERHGLNELGRGDFFGELALIENRPRSASVVALEETECLLFVVWEFRALLKEHPEMAIPIMNALIERLHRAEH
ncbi:MAG: hypothetical protein A2X23_00985 [Chloroflexi bacterium GWC2_73_18]|nr:MAG: hypothetical protein A2X23_00985 [Chloroflexi bacterium GWC2_73_18]